MQVLGGLNLKFIGAYLSLGIQHHKEEPEALDFICMKYVFGKEKYARAACTELVLYL
jgi:hypothetical protein